MAVKVGGVRDIRRELKKVGERLLKATDQALEDEGIAIIGEARPGVPVDTGLTRDTAFVERRAELKWQAGYQTSYAPIIHVTHRTKANWFGTVVDQARQNFAARMRASIRLRLGLD
jgi:hypothetical protein